MFGTTLALGGYITVFFKELRAILFSRADAEAAGIRATAVWTGFLILAAATLTVNFQTVGGLMIYSLISNPAAAAFQVARGCGRVLVASAAFGAASGPGGFLDCGGDGPPQRGGHRSGVVGLVARRGRGSSVPRPVRAQGAPVGRRSPR